MAHGSIVFVHGTGVRLEGYRSGFAQAKGRAAKAGIAAGFIDCAWGDPLGVRFSGKSLPDAPSEKQLAREGEEFARWSWLLEDPLFELDKLTLRDLSVASDAALPPGVDAPWLQRWKQIAAYRPSTELELLLERAGIVAATWDAAWAAVIVTNAIAPLAFERSAHELPEAGAALARALVAQLHVESVRAGRPGPSSDLRNSLVDRLLIDWHFVVLAPGGFFIDMLKRTATTLLKQHRSDLSALAAPLIGDVLLYQTHGEKIRRFIRGKIESAEPPVSLVAHSLGGIACVDLLAMADPPQVERLVTVGSQSPLLYEIGALASLKNGAPLPEGFPRWLNVFDRNDMLSYVVHRLFEQATDFEARSGQPFPDSHSAYFGNDLVWSEIRDFIR